MPGWLTAKQAAEACGYEYTWFTRLLKEERVPGALFWEERWMIPDDITEADILTPDYARPSAEHLPWLRDDDEGFYLP